MAVWYVRLGESKDISKAKEFSIDQTGISDILADAARYVGCGFGYKVILKKGKAFHIWDANKNYCGKWRTKI